MRGDGERGKGKETEKQRLREGKLKREENWDRQRLRKRTDGRRQSAAGT